MCSFLIIGDIKLTVTNHMKIENAWIVRSFNFHFHTVYCIILFKCLQFMPCKKRSPKPPGIGITRITVW